MRVASAAAWAFREGVRTRPEEDMRRSALGRRVQVSKCIRPEPMDLQGVTWPFGLLH